MSLAVLAAAFVPHSFVFFVFYAESLFFLAVTMACYYIRTGGYGRAGLAATVRTAIRPPGFMLMVYALVHAVRKLGIAGVTRPQHSRATFAVHWLSLQVLVYWATYTIAFLLGIAIAYQINTRFVFRVRSTALGAATFPLVYVASLASVCSSCGFGRSCWVCHRPMRCSPS